MQSWYIRRMWTVAECCSGNGFESIVSLKGEVFYGKCWYPPGKRQNLVLTPEAPVYAMAKPSSFWTVSKKDRVSSFHPPFKLPKSYTEFYPSGSGFGTDTIDVYDETSKTQWVPIEVNVLQDFVN